jgi:hypothetical protein
MREIAVDLLALLDWNDDGREDWLVRCTVALPDSAERREYLLIADPLAEPLYPLVLGAYDCRGEDCALYATPAELRGLPPETDVIELVSGQRIVTSPPANTASSSGTF